MKGTKLLLYKDKLSGHRDTIVGVYSPHGDKGGILVSLSCDGRLKVWNLVNREFMLKRILYRNGKSQEDTGQKNEIGPLEYIESCLFNEKTVFCGYADGAIFGWNMKEGNLVYHFEGHDDKISSMVWLYPDRFVTSSYDQTLIFWDAMVVFFPNPRPAFQLV